MVKRKILLLLTIVAGVVCTSCGRVVRPSDNVVSHNFTLADFDEIDAAVVNVQYSVGTPGSATLTAPDNIIDLIEVRVDKGELEVALKDNVRISGRVDATLTVSSTSLREVDCAAGAVVTVGTPIMLNSDFDANVSSGAKLHIASLSCKGIDVEVSSAAEVVIDSCFGAKFEGEAAAAGNMAVRNLSIEGAISLETSSAGKIDIDSAVCRRLAIEASSVGYAIVSRGDVGTVSIEASSASSVKVGATFDGGSAEASSGASVHVDTAKLTRTESSSGGSIHSLR